MCEVHSALRRERTERSRAQYTVFKIRRDDAFDHSAHAKAASDRLDHVLQRVELDYHARHQVLRREHPIYDGTDGVRLTRDDPRKIRELLQRSVFEIPFGGIHENY